jgi:RNA polymerase sigma-70 factor (ECF subfamily)
MDDGLAAQMQEGQEPRSADRLDHEAELITRTVAGERAAFEELYRSHVGRIYTYIAYCTPRREDAEELTQEVFVKAWRKINQYRGEASLGTWLMAIAVTTCRMWYRRRSSRIAPVGSDELESLGVTPGATDVGAALAAELLDLRAAIAELPRRARDVLILHELSGYRHREIAKIMGISEGTSKAQLHRARRLVREALKR